MGAGEGGVVSSALKDARWQLAAEMAGDDGMDFYVADYAVKEGYLRIAQGFLDAHDDDDLINGLAKKFRSHD